MNLSHSIDEIRQQDLTQLLSTNQQLNDVVINLQDEVTYLKLREKKIMYLVHLLQAKGYPVTQIFEQQVKPVNTMRFDEFLKEKEREARAEEEANAKIEFSFYSDDSFLPLVDGPQIRPRKPSYVPELPLQGLPEYETSSEEGDGGPESAVGQQQV